ncbi:outer membrane beta-barrel protein [Nemorincola caseinilytica]
MRKILAVIALMVVCATRVSAQNGYSINVSSKDSLPQITKSARDFVLVQFGYASWNKETSDTAKVNTKPFAYTFNAFLCYDFPIKKSKLSFAAGLGISTTSIYMDKQVLYTSDTGVGGYDANFMKDSITGYKRYKFNTAYLQAPFELRYFSNINNRNKGFKAAIGLQVGTLLGAHTKGLRSVEGTNIKDKVSTKRYISPWNFAATARVGWGNFSIFGSYNLTNVFKDNAGPTLTPMSVGICLTGL